MNDRWRLLSLGFAGLVLLCAQNAAAREIQLGEGVSGTRIGMQMRYFEDAFSVHTIDTVISPGVQSQFLPSEEETPSFGYTPSTYWFQAAFRSSTSEKRRWFLTVEYPVLDEVVFYKIKDGKIVDHLNSGDDLPFAERPIDHRFFIYELELAPGEAASVVVKVRTTTSLQVPVRVWAPSAFFQADQAVILANGLYYGIMLIMVLYNLSIFLWLREDSYLSYVVFVGALGLLQASLAGFSFQYLWPGAVWWNSACLPVFISACIGSAAAFAYQTMPLKDLMPAGYTLTLGMMRIGWIAMVASFVLNYAIIVRVVVVVAMVGSVSIILISVWLWRQGIEMAKFFTIAWCAVFGGTAILAANKLGLISRNFLTENGQQIGSAIEITILSFALAYKFNRVKKEKDSVELRLKEESARLSDEVRRGQNLEGERALLLRRLGSTVGDLGPIKKEKERAREDLLHAQAHLVQAEKLSVFGQAMPSIAHAFSQLGRRGQTAAASLEEDLSKIRPHLEGDPALGRVLDSMARGFEEVGTTSEESMHLSGALLKYCHGSGEIFSGVAISEMVFVAQELLKFRFNNIQFEFDNAETPGVQCCPEEMMQVVLHLMMNAIDAIEEQRVRLGDTVSRFEGVMKVALGVSRRGQKTGVLLAFEDDGVGISEETLKHAFDAFYTTKTEEGGAGLGLAICYKIVNDHQGFIEIFGSSPLGGARAEVWLPLN